MSWSQEDRVITFYCDTGDESESINVDAHRTWVNAGQSDYMVAEAQLTNWIALKRAGQPWTHHCPKCAEQAEREHEIHKRNEADRERLKARNA